MFLLTKSLRYFFDQEAVREKAIEGTDLGLLRGRSKDDTGKVAWAAPSIAKRQEAGVDSRNGNPSAGRNVRSVWDIATQPYPEAHFATYPEELVRRCVLAGSSERGCCPVCGKPWERETQPSERYAAYLGKGYTDHSADRTEGMMQNRGVNRQNEMLKAGITSKELVTLGWRPGCDCDLPAKAAGTPRNDGGRWNENDGRGFKPKPAAGSTWEPGCEHRLEPIPCTVLDPFLGSGTTAYVARKHGRRSIGIELNPAYADLAARRMAQQSLEFAWLSQNF